VHGECNNNLFREPTTRPRKRSQMPHPIVGNEGNDGGSLVVLLEQDAGNVGFSHQGTKLVPSPGIYGGIVSLEPGLYESWINKS